MSDLKPEHQAFINQYFLRNMNATRAYMDVYGCDYNVAGVSAHHLLKKPKIQNAIQDRLKAMQAGPDEIIARFSEWARGDYTNYINPDGEVDIERLIQDGKAHYIKSIKETKFGRTYEFHDPMAASNTLAKIQGLLTNTVKVENWQDEIIQLLIDKRIEPDDVMREFPNEASHILARAGFKITRD